MQVAAIDAMSATRAHRDPRRSGRAGERDSKLDVAVNGSSTVVLAISKRAPEVGVGGRLSCVVDISGSAHRLEFGGPGRGEAVELLLWHERDEQLVCHCLQNGCHFVPFPGRLAICFGR